MHAILCDNYGPVDTLRYAEIASPSPDTGEVLVKIHAAGVNFPDALLVQGLYQAKPQLPFVPGMEFCGEVVALGEGVNSPAIGQRVIGFNPHFGAFAEYTVAPVQCLYPVDSAISDSQAANLLCAHGTAQHALTQRAHLQPGEQVLVLGAAGGTGLAAVQIAKAMGASVIAAASTPGKCELAKTQGADHVINYAREDLKDRVREITHGAGVNVVYDPVGGDAFDTSCRVMARGGRLLVIGFASGRIPSLPVNLALVKEFSVVGVFWGNFVANDAAQSAANVAELLQWHREGKITVSVERSYPLAETAAALNHVVSRRVTGKVAITVSRAD